MYVYKHGIIQGPMGSAQSLTSAAVVARFAPTERVQLQRIQFSVSTATVSSASIVITVKKYITPNSASGAVTLGTLTIPTGVAAGKVYYKDIDPQAIKVGEEIVFEVTTQAAGGGAAGAGFSLPVCIEFPESELENTDMVESA